MPFPFVFWTHPATGKRAIYPGKASMAYRLRSDRRYIVPLARPVY